MTREEKGTMEVSATMFEKDMHGNTVKEEVHITYFLTSGLILTIKRYDTRRKATTA
jgi:hypothetical protein